MNERDKGSTSNIIVAHKWESAGNVRHSLVRLGGEVSGKSDMQKVKHLQELFAEQMVPDLLEQRGMLRGLITIREMVRHIYAWRNTSSEGGEDTWVLLMSPEKDDEVGADIVHTPWTEKEIKLIGEMFSLRSGPWVFADIDKGLFCLQNVADGQA